MSEAANPTESNPTKTDQGAGGNNNSNEFLNSLGEGFATHEAFTGIEDVNGLASKFSDLHAQHSELQASIPKSPESPNDYTVPDPPAGVKNYEDGINAWKEAAHKLGLSNEQFQAAVNVNNQMLSAQYNKVQKESQELIESMKAESGNNWDADRSGVNELVEKLNLKEMLNQPDPSGEKSILGTNPLIFRALLTISKAVSVDSLASASGPGSGNRPQTTDGRPMFSYPSMENN